MTNVDLSTSKNKTQQENAMRKIKIVADSSCDIFGLEGVDFAYAPMKMITEEREFVDDETLDVDSVVEYFDKYKGKSKSSCPNAGDWLQAFGDADDIICITITSALSGSYLKSRWRSKKRVNVSKREWNTGRNVIVYQAISKRRDSFLCSNPSRPLPITVECHPLWQDLSELRGYVLSVRQVTRVRLSRCTNAVERRARLR